MNTVALLIAPVTALGLIYVVLRRDLAFVPRVQWAGISQAQRHVQRILAVAGVLALLLQMIPVNVPSPSETTASLIFKAPAPFNTVAPYLSRAVAPLDTLILPFSNIQPVFADPTVGITITKSAPASVNQNWGGDTEITYQFTLTNPSAYTITVSSLVTDSVPLSTTYKGGNPGPDWKLLSGGPVFELTGTITSTVSYVGLYRVAVNKPVPDRTIITNTNYCFTGTVGITPTQFCETTPIATEIRAPDFNLTESWTSDSGAVCAGQRLTYTITVSNPGGVDTTQPFTITGIITNPLIIYTDTLSADATSVGNVITWSITSTERFLNAGGSDTLTRTFAVSVPASLADGTYLTNTYTITSPEVAPTQGSWSSSGVRVSRATAAFTSNSPVCVGTAMVFTNTSTNATAYQWNFGDGSPVTTTISPTHVYTASGNFTVVLTATGTCGSDVTTGTVTVTPGAVAGFTPLSTTICTGQSVTFTNTSTNATAYQWNFGDGSPVTTTVSPNHVFTNTGAVPVTRTVTLTATGTCGSDVTTGTVIINPLPSVSFATNSPVILGQTMYFTNTGDIGTYQWNFGDSSPIETTRDVTHTYSAVGDYLVWLTTTLGTGCWDAYSATVTVTDVTGCEDVYEPDNDYTTATTVTIPSLTSHNFDDGGDADWAVFSGTAGITYTIETLNLAVGVDTKLYFYSWNGITLTLLTSHDDRNPPGDLSSIITWPVTSTGWYYVQVGRFTGGFFGCDATYGLSIIRTGESCTTTLTIVPETLPVGNTATMTATVVDCHSTPLAGQVITFSTASGLGSGSIGPVTATTNASGWAISYISSTLAGTKLVTATAPNLVAGTDTVTFTAGPPFTITLIATPDTLPVSNTAVLSATVVDQYANPVSAQVITFTSSGLGSGGVNPVTATTNASGQATSYISSTLAGVKPVTATASNLVTGTTTVTFTAPSGCEDAYEPDDSRAEATTVTPPSTTRHNFHDAPDVDWVVFSGTVGITYTIETLNLTTNVDTKLNFYSWDGSTLTLLASNDDRNPGDLSSLITWVVTSTGWYYVEVGRFTGSYYGCDAYYDLHIAGPPAYVYLPLILKEHPPPEPTPTPSPPTPTPGPCYPMVETIITVGNDPRGVAYNGDDDRIYVANYVDGTVSVINGATYGVDATISGVAGAHGVAYDSGHSLVYVTKRNSNELAVIDASTNAVSQTIPVGSQPHGVAYNPTSHKIYVANYGDNSVTIIDANTMTTTITISGLSKPAHITANHVSNKVYVSNHGSGTVTVIRGTDDVVLATVSLGSAGPYGIAADTQRNLIYVVSIEVANLSAPNLVTIDGDTDQVQSNMWGRVNIHKSDDSLVPLRVIAVHPGLGSSGHLYITSSSGDVAGDGSHGTDQLLMSRKGWPEGFNRPNPLDVGRRPEEGIAVDLANNRVFVTARDANRLTVIRDTADQGQLCVTTFALDGYVIEPVP